MSEHEITELDRELARTLGRNNVDELTAKAVFLSTWGYPDWQQEMIDWLSKEEDLDDQKILKKLISIIDPDWKHQKCKSGSSFFCRLSRRLSILLHNYKSSLLSHRKS